jgi:hypothetical protein
VNQNTSHPANAVELMDRIDSLLARADLGKDVRRGALVALTFCDLLIDLLDNNQRRAVEVAREFLARGHSDDHRHYVSIFANVIDADMRQGVDRRKSAINRLVWSALNTNTEFTGYATEYLVGWGEDAGLTVQAMSEVFSKYVPGF